MATRKPRKIEYAKILDDMLTRRGKIAECYSIFHDYSMLNQVCLVNQYLDRGQQPAPVATYKKWASLDRQVKKGAKALWMWIPTVRKEETVDKETGEKKERSWLQFYFKPLWFSVSDTEGADIQDKLDAVSQVFDLDGTLRELGIKRVPFRMINGNAQGYMVATSGNIAINPVAAHPEKTALHEIAHSLMHRDSNADLPKGQKEVEAEATALICGTVLNILSDEEQEESVGYIRHWMQAADPDVLTTSAKRIFAAVDKILRANKNGNGGSLPLAKAA